MKKMKKMFAIILATAMVIGAAFTVDAGQNQTHSCPACGQYNQYYARDQGKCRIFVCQAEVRKYICGKCGVTYYVCEGATNHYQ